MVFSSLTFLCVFFPVVYLLYLILPGMKSRNGLLLLASLIFYAYGEPVCVFLLIGNVTVNYLLALAIERSGRARIRKLLAILSVLVNMGMLAVFKYADFAIGLFNDALGTALPLPGIRLPIGISFFSFQALSYVIDVFRGKVKAQKSLPLTMLYISFFPQLIAGPIVKYHDIESNLANRVITSDGIYYGIRRFIQGLCKKVLIANTMAAAADFLFDSSLSAQTGPACAWVGAVSFFFQIYFDFSGYSDMAIGMGNMFGFRFRENFDHPYASSSMKEFWRRWHISLSSWFREYVYFPLGGNRRGKARTILNKWIIFFLTGLWHGASLNFVFWGLYHGFFLMLEEVCPFPGKQVRSGDGGQSFARRIAAGALRHAYVILVAMIGFVFFRAESIRQGLSWVSKMLFLKTGMETDLLLAISQLTPLYLTTLVLAVFFSLWSSKSGENSSAVEDASFPVRSSGRSQEGAVLWKRASGDVLLLAGYVLCLLSLAGGSYNPFIYFRF